MVTNYRNESVLNLKISVWNQKIDELFKQISYSTEIQATIRTPTRNYPRTEEKYLSLEWSE